MHRCSSGVFLTITLTFAIALTGCLGKSSPSSANGGVQSVSLSPGGNFSLEVGGTQVFSASATDASGHTIIGTIQFIVSTPPNSNGPAPLSVASNGNACAGTWDPTDSICTAGTPGIALVTAVVNGVSSPATTVYVHYHIDSLQVVQAQTQAPQYDCFSQGQTWLYEGLAYNNGVDITSTVGQLTWSSTNSGVITTTPYLPPNQPTVLNQVQIKAASPGITQLYASVSGTTSTPVPITTCLVQYVRVRAQNLNENSVTVDTGGSVALQATVIDTLGYTLTKPPLTWSTTNPEVVSFSSLTNSTGTNSATARANLGGADVTASCTPPTCNIGIAGYLDPYSDPPAILPGMPVYASTGTLPNGLQGYGTISVDVISTAEPPTYLAWAATTQCGDAPGCTSTIFQITPGTAKNPITASATVPRTPNSMMFNYQTSARVYLGSDQGLMYMDAGSAPAVKEVSSATTPCNVVLCGTVLAISNDGKQVVVSDTVSATPQVYIYNSSGAVTDLILPNVASATAFSPDQSKIFILTNVGTMYVYSTVDALAPVQIPTSGTTPAVAFSADGSFAYVATTAGGSGSVSAFSTCANPGVPSTELGNPVSTTYTPWQIFPSPNLPSGNSNLITQNIYVLESSTNIPTSVQVLTAQFAQVPIAVTPALPGHSQLTCNPPNLYSLVAGPTYNLGQGAFTPIYARLVADGSEMIVVASNVSAVLIFNVGSGTSSIRLGRSGYTNIYPLSASSSTDGSQVYVAACDQYPNNDPTQPCAAGSVHIVNTISGNDFQQVPFINNSTNNMCNNPGSGAPLCVSDLVAIVPQ